MIIPSVLYQKIRTIQYIVATHFQLTLELMLSTTRKRDILLPRQISIYLCHLYLFPDASSSILGSCHGGKDHATALYSIKIIETLMLNNIDLIKTINDLSLEVDSVLGNDSINNLRNLDKRILSLLKYRRFLKHDIQKQKLKLNSMP